MARAKATLRTKTKRLEPPRERARGKLRGLFCIMKLIVGLGNPGGEYAANRHNIGFMAVDEIARVAGAGPWQKKFQSELSEGRIANQKVLLLKPMTYMNLSGQAVGEAARFYKIEPSDIIVFHDELDLQPSKVRVKLGGGHAGHNGLKSMMAHVGEGFWRVRLGIGHPGAKHLVSNYVLGNFAKSDDAWMSPLMSAIARDIALLVEGDEKSFQSKVSQGVNDAVQRMASAVYTRQNPKPAPAPFAPRKEEAQSLSPFEKLKNLLKGE